MDIIKSSRFWLTLVVCVGVGVLAVLKILGGDAALAAWLGILSGFSIGKIPGGSNSTTDVANVLGPVLTKSLTGLLAKDTGSVTKPIDPPTLTPPVTGIVLLFLLPVLALATGCVTTETKLIKATPVVTALRQELKTYLNTECEATVDVCKKAGKMKVEDCKELTACWEKRANVYKVTMSLELAIKTGLGLIGLGEEDEAKVILAKVSSGLMDLYSELQNYKIITLK